VVATHPRVAEGRALLLGTEHLADERIDIDDQAPLAGAGPRSPGALKCLGQDAVELADVPETKRPQECPERRRRSDLVAEHLAGPARAQHVAVVDGIGAQRHRRHQRHHLRARVGRARSLTEVDGLIDQRPDPQPLRERRRQHDPGVGDGTLIVELHRETFQSDRAVSMHHQGDLLLQPRTPHTSDKSAAPGGHSSFTAGRNRPARSAD